MSLASPADSVPRLSTALSWRDTLKRWALRWGLGRETSMVEPGLYRIGKPLPSSPVIVTCNYRMTIDLVRSDLDGIDAWLLVLQTHGVNVWCAAGKGTFGTDELVWRVFDSHLADYVDHETLVLPQLGAVGVAAHKVRAATGYRVTWGPVLSADLPAFLAADRKATPEMRSVTFPLAQRLALAPVELVGTVRWTPAILLLIGLAVLGASIGARAFVPLAALSSLFPSVLMFVLGALGGGLLVPVLLPWLPGRAFSVKGAVAGGVLSLVVLLALSGMFGGLNAWGWAAALLGVSALASYVGVNFTGSTPYTSPSGVERELRRAIPLQVAAAAASLFCWTVSWAMWATRIGG